MIADEETRARMVRCLRVNRSPSAKDSLNPTRGAGSSGDATDPDFFLKPRSRVAAASRFAAPATMRVNGADITATRTPAIPGEMIPTEVSTVSLRA